MKKKLLSLLLCLLMVLPLLAGCASHGKTLIEAEGNDISVNVFQLYLSRMKYSLHAAGDKVDSQSYWETFVDTDNQTMAQYYTKQVLEGLKQIAAALILYDEKGLKLPQEEIDTVDAYIDTLIEEVGGGSKSQLNSVLSAYGANITVLRDAYLIEAKLEQLKKELYGTDASKVADTAKEEFYRGLYYRGKQMLIANSYNDYEEDADGLPIYYVLSDKGALTDKISYLPVKDGEVEATDQTDKNGDTVHRTHGTIAYDTENGTLAYDTVDGEKTVRRDQYGDPVYVLESGRVAYDKAEGRAKKNADGEGFVTDQNGDTVYYKWVVAYDRTKGGIKYLYDANGEHKVVSYSQAEMDKRLWRAREIAKWCSESKNEADFDDFAELYGDNSKFSEFAPNGMYFAAGSVMSDEIFSTLAAEIYKLQPGETAVLNSSSGYFVVMRCELDAGAWKEEGNATWFESFNELLTEHMLQNMLKSGGYLDKVSVNDKILAGVDITMVDKNNFY